VFFYLSLRRQTQQLWKAKVLDVHRMGIRYDAQRLARGLFQLRQSAKRLYAHIVFDIIVYDFEFIRRFQNPSTIPICSLLLYVDINDR